MIEIMSAHDKSMDALSKGAIGYLTKPVSNEQLDSVFNEIENIILKDVKDIIVVEDDDNLRKSISQMLDSKNVKLETTNKGKEAIQLVKSKKFDCMILDLNLGDISGFDVLNEIIESDDYCPPPVIVYTGKEFTDQEQLMLNKYADSVVIWGLKSDERLIDETTLFLHIVVEQMNKKTKMTVSQLHDIDGFMKDKMVLLVDDDMRNLFAITEELKDKGMRVFKATNGQEALDVLNDDPNFDIMLMDIMMPAMDGYETISQIRKNNNYSSRPIIAFTANVMKESLKKSIAAGANNYLTKPLDIGKLFTMIGKYVGIQEECLIVQDS